MPQGRSNKLVVTVAPGKRSLSSSPLSSPIAFLRARFQGPKSPRPESPSDVIEVDHGDGVEPEVARKQREIASFLGKAVSPASRELAPAASPAVPVTLAEAVKPLTREVVEACATMVASMYELDTAAADARVLFAPIEAHVESIQWASATLEVHGVLDVSLPPFGYAVVQMGGVSTMLLLWRGSHTIMDWVSDVDATPVVSRRWSRDGKSPIRAHGAYVSLCENDLAAHEGRIVSLMLEHKVQRMILTGHSLAGGLAHVGHLFVRGQIEQGAAPWNQLDRGVHVSTLGFAAPMTILSEPSLAQLDPDVHGESHAILADLNANAVNVVYGVDVVPRLPGCLGYLNEVLELSMPMLVEKAVDEVGTKVHLPSYLKRLLARALSARDGLREAYMQVKGSKDVETLVEVMIRFDHVGRVLHYPQGETPGTLQVYEGKRIKEVLGEGPGAPLTTAKDLEALAHELEAAHQRSYAMFKLSARV